jgi:DNA (cytosine-5)-methyltransferase 1
MISLFSGCGGMDLGFEGGFSVFKPSVNLEMHGDWVDEPGLDNKVMLRKTCFETVFANDISLAAKRAWCNFFSKFGRSDSVFNLGSIVDLIKENMFGASLKPGDVSVLTGGFPCQDFSLAGKREGFHSTKSHFGVRGEGRDSEESRGNLYLWMLRAVEAARPSVFVAENVKGMRHIPRAVETIRKAFSEAIDGEYLVLSPKVLAAPEYGVPQLRERLVFIGLNKKRLRSEALKALSKEVIPEEYDPYPPRTHIFNRGRSNGEKLASSVTCGQVLLDLPEPGRARDESQKHYSKARFLDNGSQGQTEVKLGGVSPTVRSEHHGNIEFRRLSPENGGSNALVEKKTLPQRRLTVRECARLQTFPDEYEFVFDNDFGKVSASSAYKLIGNAVPPLLAYNIAKRLERNWQLFFEE